jgi:hypothetical protein
LHIDVIADGVENEIQYEFLRKGLAVKFKDSFSINLYQQIKFSNMAVKRDGLTLTLIKIW